MKYRYSKIAFICSAIITGTIVFLILFLYGIFINAEKNQYFKVFFICSVFFVFCVFMFANEYLNRYVEIFDEHIRFNSFRFKRIKNVVSMSVSYEDIFSINPKKLPLIGLWGIKINARNLPHEVTLSICFCKHKKMFKAICDEAKQHKPDIYIDSYIQKYLEKNYE